MNKFNEENNTNLTFISPSLSLQNAKYFLENYQYSKNNAIFSQKFINESPLYSKESVVPDSFYKLHKPFDRNLIFYIGHGPYGTSKKRYNFLFKNRENYFPRYTLILSSSCQLISKLNKRNKKFIESDDNVLNDKLEEGEKDFMINDLANKVWNMKLVHENITSQYGPYSSKVIFQFLKNYYMPLNQQEQKKMNLLISDIMYDIYYQPDALYQMLQVELDQN
jgi:hypothetical protein